MIHMPVHPVIFDRSISFRNDLRKISKTFPVMIPAHKRHLIIIHNDRRSIGHLKHRRNICGRGWINNNKVAVMRIDDLLESCVIGGSFAPHDRALNFRLCRHHLGDRLLRKGY